MRIGSTGELVDIAEPTAVPGGTSTVFHDTCGNLIGLMQLD